MTTMMTVMMKKTNSCSISSLLQHQQPVNRLSNGVWFLFAFHLYRLMRFIQMHRPV